MHLVCRYIKKVGCSYYSMTPKNKRDEIVLSLKNGKDNNDFAKIFLDVINV